MKERAGPWKYPRWIDVRTDLPRTATGKIQRFKLRDQESSGADCYASPARRSVTFRHGPGLSAAMPRP